jgi:hypothetical protein
MALSPQQKIGRNDPCPCGSGKKYKQCCLKVASPTESSPWIQQHDASAWLAQEMMSFARQNFASNLGAAWLDYNLDPSPIPLEEDGEEAQIFVPYFLFDWDPKPPSRRGPPVAGVIARSYLSKKGSRLPELERLILEQALTQPLSFYEIVQCHPGERLLLRDVLLGEEVEVVEHTASRMLRPGDISYGQLCELPEVTTFGRLAPLCISPSYKASVVRLRKTLQKKIARQNRELTVADLILYREDIRGTYLDIRDSRRTPPRLTNTDGDPFILHTLTFRTGSALVAFEALAPLARGFSKAELLKGAKFDARGALLAVELPWQKKGNRIHKDWDSTLLGQLSISGRSLVVEVNSEKRAAKIRQEIERRLGILVTHQKTVTQGLEAGLKTKPKHSQTANLPKPEFTAEVHAEVQRQAENWIYQKVPALGGRTPLEAIKDPDGREVVESLLLGWERQIETMTDAGVLPLDVKAIRRLLQLAATPQCRLQQSQGRLCGSSIQVDTLSGGP